MDLNKRRNCKCQTEGGEVFHVCPLEPDASVLCDCCKDCEFECNAAAGGDKAYKEVFDNI